MTTSATAIQPEYVTFLSIASANRQRTLGSASRTSRSSQRAFAPTASYSRSSCDLSGSDLPGLFGPLIIGEQRPLRGRSRESA